MVDEIRQLWAAVRTRIDAFDPEVDSASILDPALLAQVRRMVELVRAEPTDGALRGPVLDAAARLHLCRYLAMPGDSGIVEYRTALALFSALAAVDVSLVSEELRRVVAPDTEADFPTGWTGRVVDELLVGAMDSGYPEPLDRIVDLLGRALRATPADRADHVGYLCGLGVALQARFRLTGELGDLERAIAGLRAAAADMPPDHPGRGRLMCDLGITLCARFDRAGQLDDLNEAISALTDAITSTPRQHLTRVVCLNNLGNARLTRFGQTRTPDDLDAAVLSLGEAVRLLPARHSELPAALSNLAAALLSRWELTGQSVDLDRAIRHATEAARLTPGGRPNRGAYLNTLAKALRERFLRTGDVSGLDEAIGLFRESVSLVPTGHPDRAKYLSNLAKALHTRFERSRVPADAWEATEVWREAAGVPTAPALVRLSAARSWGALAVAVGRDPAAGLDGYTAGLDGYTAAIELLPRAAWRGVDRATREQVLAEWNGLAGAAAACAIAAGRPDRALELLERGRAVLWTQLLETRSDRAALREVAPDVGERLDEIAAELDREGGEATEEMIDRRMRLAHEWDTQALRAHEILGPESMLAAPAFDDLRTAAGGGPVVVLNLSRWRCDALIVRSTEPEPQVVELPELTGGDERARAQQFLSALLDYEASDDDLVKRQALDQAATETLSWLWQTVARPVLTALRPEEQMAENGEWPRLWWCPTGPLTLLPLHAAAHDDPEDPEGSGAVIDRVISSYTPTLRALARARTAQDDKVSREDQRLLRVYMGSTPGEAGLSAVDRSSPYLDQVFPPDRQTVLPGPDETYEAVTVEAVMAELTRHGWVHFGCHGTQELDNPSTGGLRLYDQTLTVATLSNLRPDQAEFAFLAACKTAVGGTGVPDEAINLAVALQYAGYSHVIGTLWSVSDRAAVRVTNAVYGALHSAGRVDPKDVARELHHAVRAERARFRSHPWAWAHFLHAGP